jgi:hypothetical protein
MAPLSRICPHVHCKVDRLYLVIMLFLVPHLVFEWYVVSHGSKNGYQKERKKNLFKTYWIAGHTQSMITILILVVNVIGGGAYDHLMSTRMFTLVMTEVFI